MEDNRPMIFDVLYTAETEAITKARNELEAHLEAELRSVRPRNRNLVSGFFGKRLASMLDECGGAPQRALLAFSDVVEIDFRLNERLRHNANFAILNGLLRREAERLRLNGLDELPHDAASVSYRRQWTDALSPADARHELLKLSDWIESNVARTAFVTFRTDPKTMSSEPIEAEAHTTVMWLHGAAEFDGKAKSIRLREEWDELGNR